MIIIFMIYSQKRLVKSDVDATNAILQENEVRSACPGSSCAIDVQS